MVDVAAQNQAMIITASSDESPEREREVVLNMCAQRIAGLCLVTTRNEHSYLGPEIASGLPVVLLDRPASDLDADTVLLDNIGGAMAVVSHLVNHGHRRIAVVGDHAHVQTVRLRLEGFERALSEHGITFDPRLKKLGRHTTIDAAAATHELLALSDPPTAFFGLNNRATIGIVRAMRDRGQQRALIGFDDFETADLLSLPVTVVTYDLALLGKTTAELVFARINGDTSPKKEIVLPTTLVPRGSGELQVDGR
jgi:LacI family transcriptional regulator